jgi:hypothetical protein
VGTTSAQDENSAESESTTESGQAEAGMIDDQEATQSQTPEVKNGQTSDEGTTSAQDENSSESESTTEARKAYYDVELIVQEANPICWVASCAMVESFGTKQSVGVGKYTGGFDPSNSCIPNPADDWDGCVTAMNGWGFSTFSVAQLASDGSALTTDDLFTILSQRQPMVLLHKCDNFPYGSQWSTTGLAGNAHAVVITGIDADSGEVWFNNPWGDKDQSADADTIIQLMNADASRVTMGFWPSE